MTSIVMQNSTTEIDVILYHLAEMFEARGEDIDEFVEHGDAIRDRMQFYTSIEPVILDTDLTKVIFALTKDHVKRFFASISPKEVNTPERMHEVFDRKNVILVVSEMPIPTNMTMLQQQEKLLEGGIFQVFTKAELKYNPSKHELVPQHEKMKEAEVKELLEKYNIRGKAHLPVILKTDVMAKWLGLRPGDVVRITRYNDTSGLYYYYRCCM